MGEGDGVCEKRPLASAASLRGCKPETEAPLCSFGQTVGHGLHFHAGGAGALG